MPASSASTASPIPLPNAADYTCYGTNAWPQRFLQVANPFAVRALRRALAEFRPDVVHVRMFLTQLSPGILPLLEDVPALLHVGNHQTVCPLNSKILPDGSVCTVRAGVACYRAGCVSLAGLARAQLQLHAWRRRRGVFRLIVANSRALAATLADNDIEAGEVIGNGTRVTPPRPPLLDPPTVAYAGRLVPLKGADDLVRAMAIAVRQVPGARLLMAGDGPDRPRIERLIDDHGVRGAVTMLGHVPRPRLDEVLGAAWVQAIPSRYLEPFTNTAAEAMMRGTAVVATATGGTPEIVGEGETGFLVPPGEPAGLAERLVQLLRNRELAEQMGAKARAFAQAELTVDRMVDRFEEVYRRLLA